MASGETNCSRDTGTAISTQGRAPSPPELTLHEQPALLLHAAGERQQRGNATASAEGMVAARKELLCEQGHLC